MVSGSVPVRGGFEFKDTSVDFFISFRNRKEKLLNMSKSVWRYVLQVLFQIMGITEMNTLENPLNPMVMSSSIETEQVQSFIHGAVVGFVGTSQNQSTEAIIHNTERLEMCFEGGLTDDISIIEDSVCVTICFLI